jgi:hypothetical protein
LTASLEISVLTEDFGAGSRTRTDDLLITNQLLYQLSYAGKAWTGEGSILAREQAGGISASPAGDFVFERLPTTGTLIPRAIPQRSKVRDLPE